VHAALAEGDCVGLFPRARPPRGDEMLKVPLVALRARGRQRGARASLRDPLRARRRHALPRGGLRGRALVHAILRAW
jgi:hypothetical protein